MNISLKSVKSCNVFRYGSASPWGIVRSLFLCADSGKVEALLIDTLSLVPLSYKVDICDIAHIRNRSVFLKPSCPTATIILKDSFTAPEKLDCITPTTRKTFRLHDLNFDMETGDISDVVLSKNLLSKKNKISINKIRLKDNTIYIE